jgi:hypothetical protein
MAISCSKAALPPPCTLAHLHTIDHKRGSLPAIIQQVLCHCPCIKAALPPPCTLAHLHTVITRGAPVPSDISTMGSV